MSVDELIAEERKAIKTVEDTKVESEKIISEAREKAKQLVGRVTKREFLEARLKEEEEKAEVEADAIKKMYEAEVAKIRQQADKNVPRAVSFVLGEVLKI